MTYTPDDEMKTLIAAVKKAIATFQYYEKEHIAKAKIAIEGCNYDEAVSSLTKAKRNYEAAHDLSVALPIEPVVVEG